MKKILLLIFLLGFFSSVSIYAAWDRINSNEITSAPLKYELSQNYPNPFNPETTVKFVIEKEENVTLRVYNVIGQEVMTVLSEVLSEGEHSVTIDARDLQSGVYFYTLTAGDFTQTKRMMLVK